MEGPSDRQVTSNDDYDEGTGRGSEVLLRRQFLWIHMRVWEMDRAEQAYTVQRRRRTEELGRGGDSIQFQDTSARLTGGQ